MSNLQTYYHFNLDFQKVDQHTGGKWLIHGTKRRKDNQLQSLIYQEHLLRLRNAMEHNVPLAISVWGCYPGLQSLNDMQWVDRRERVPG